MFSAKGLAFSIANPKGKTQPLAEPVFSCYFHVLSEAVRRDGSSGVWVFLDVGIKINLSCFEWGGFWCWVICARCSGGHISHVLCFCLPLFCPVGVCLSPCLSFVFVFFLFCAVLSLLVWYVVFLFIFCFAFALFFPPLLVMYGCFPFSVSVCVCVVSLCFLCYVFMLSVGGGGFFVTGWFRVGEVCVFSLCVYVFRCREMHPCAMQFASSSPSLSFCFSLRFWFCVLSLTRVCVRVLQLRLWPFYCS